MIWRMVLGWWRRHQRWTDVSILWPQLLEASKDRDWAEAAFRMHMQIDPAYSDLSEREKTSFVEELP